MKGGYHYNAQEKGVSMSQHNFAALKKHYPHVIATMTDPFTSHEFILELAQRHQGLYIDALAAYRTTFGFGSPFKTVHGILARLLKGFADKDGKVPSRNIFGQDGKCEQWRKR